MPGAATGELGVGGNNSGAVCVCVAMQSGRLSGPQELNEIGRASVPGARGMALFALLVPPVAGPARLFTLITKNVLQL